MFFWFSQTGENEAWKPATADQRANVISTFTPSFVTVLDAARTPQDDWERADFLKLAYSGPLYFDFDLDTTDEEGLVKTTNAFKLFLIALQDDYDVNLQTLKLFATGGRGYHIEVPMKTFITKVPTAGVPMLPMVYREMAIELAVETLDLAIYSTRRGRMWRVPNIERKNGRFKVPISVAEALSMDSETYLRLTSAPRYYRGDPATMKDSPWLYAVDGELAPPMEAQIALSLQSMFADKREQVDNQIRKQAKVRDERATLAKYRGEVPASILSLMAGEHLREDLGFNTIALQLCIVGAAFGLNVTDFMAKCEGFVTNHNGDGSRYNSPRRRADALRDRYMYVQDSPVYVFSMGGLKSICAGDYTPADIFGAPGLHDAPQFNPDADASADPYSSVPEDMRAAVEMAERSDSTDGIVMFEFGIFQRKQDSSLSKLSDISLMSPWVQVDVETGKVVGYSAVVVVSKAGMKRSVKGRVSIPANVFNSRAALDGFCQGFSSFYKGSDIGATVVRNIINTTAIKENEVQYVLIREGVDIINNPEGDNEPLLVWATVDRVLTHEDVNDTQERKLPKFVCRPRANNKHIKIDVHNVDIPQQSAEFVDWFNTVLQINRPAAVANMLGWSVSCYHRQFHHRSHGQFPILFLYGPAGAGKSTMPSLFMRMFATSPPQSWDQVTRGTTNYAIQAILSRSTTMPAVIDEFKRDTFHETEYNKMLAEFRFAYNQTLFSKGGGDHDGSAKSDWMAVTATARTTPLMVISEALVNDSATRERLVPVNLTRQSQNSEAWLTAYSETNRQFMTQIGSLILRRTLRMTFEEFDRKYRETSARLLREYPYFHRRERQLANLVVVTMGLEFLSESLIAGLGLDMSDKLAELAKAALGDMMQENDVAPIVPNSIKALQDLAYMSRQPDGEIDPRHALRETKEYIVDEGFIDIDMQATYRRYVAFARSSVIPLVLDTYAAFLGSLAREEATVDTRCADSKLRSWSAQTIFRFDANALGARGVEPFRCMAAEKA